jgi:deoxyribonuclease-4
MNRLRQRYDLKPLVIHANYLINMASITDEFYRKAIEALRGEMQRGLNLCAEYLVLHPGSFRGMTRQQGLARAAEGIARAVEGLAFENSGLKLLIENTAGAEFSLGGSFEQVAELITMLRPILPVAACIDTCHIHVAGYDIVSDEGYDQTLRHLDDVIGLHNVPVWHCNDAKATRGSKLDRHQHIGKGTIGQEPFRRLLNDPRTKHAAFIAETPIDEPGDDMRNVEALKKLVENAEAVATKTPHRKKRA